MRLIINKALNNTNDVVNLKVIELLSTDLLDNGVDYFSYKYQIPLIKFTDTGEVFNIRNFKNRIDLSLTETELILDETDLELISSAGGESPQDLQSILDSGSTAEFDDGAAGVNILSGSPYSRSFGFYFSNEAFTKGSSMYSDNVTFQLQNSNSDVDKSFTFLIENGDSKLSQRSASNTTNIIFGTPIANTTISFPAKSIGTYTLATLEDIYAVGALIPTYADNAAAVTGGLALHGLYKTATGEIRVRV